MAYETATTGDGQLPVSRPADDVCLAVSGTCRRLYAAEDQFIGCFRASLAQLVPELSYTTDRGAEIADGLARAVLWAGLTADPPEVVEVTFQNVGAEYRKRGFPEGGYHGAGHALLRAARDIHVAEWTSELSSAWVAYYGWLSAHLAVGASQVEMSTPGPAAAADSARPVSPTMSSGPPPGSLPASAFSASAFSASAFSASASSPPGLSPPAPTPTGLELSGPSSLDEVLDLLQTRYFAGNERALGAILTRVALRTGADLRAPRPDQRTNPAVIANVIAVLQVMGYVLQPGGSEAVQQVFSPSPPESTVVRRWGRRRAWSRRSVPEAPH